MEDWTDEVVPGSERSGVFAAVLDDKSQIL